MNIRHVLQSVLVVLCVTTPLMAQAPLPPVSSPSVNAGGHHHGRNAWQQAVALTPQQRQEVKPLQKAFNGQRKSLNQQFHSSMQSILTPPQASQLAEMRSQARASHQHLKMKQIAATLGLTPSQTQQIQALRQQMKTQRQAARQQFFSQVQPLLTADQQARLTAYLQSHHRRG